MPEVEKGEKKMKIAVAMSGGIDSTVAAILLKKEGHEVIGLTAKMHSRASNLLIESQQIADKLNIPHYTLDLTENFANEVIKPFCHKYLQGQTPNPCVICNARVKFKDLWAYALSLGCDKLATGHYVKIKVSEEGRFYLCRGRDKLKDQSYFLGLLPQKILSHLLFPLGDYTKSEIRDLSLFYNLSLNNKPESQEICFIPGNNYSAFIENYLKKEALPLPSSGEVIDLKGNILGRHEGIHKYTIGQRRGLGISADRPLYVIKIMAKKNIVIIGPEEDLEDRGLLVEDLNLMKSSSIKNFLKEKVWLKSRSTQKSIEVKVSKSGNGLEVTFKGLAGITPGQLALFYNQNQAVLAAGIIKKGYK